MRELATVGRERPARLRELALERGDCRVALRDRRLGRRESSPLLLELRLELERPLLDDRRRLGLRRRRPRLGRGLVIPGRRRDHMQPPGGVPALDQGAQARSEAALAAELDPVLLGKSVRERRMRDEALLDQDLAQPLAGLLLERECVLELGSRQQAALDEQRSQGSPVQWRRIHGPLIGKEALRIEQIPSDRVPGSTRLARPVVSDGRAGKAGTS